MKPGRGDTKYRVLITGRELEELKKFTWSMAEAFGLDRRIENYKGTRPIGFYIWDLECLDTVTELALDDAEVYPGASGPGYEAMRKLHERIRQLSEQAFAEVGDR